MYHLRTRHNKHSWDALAPVRTPQSSLVHLGIGHVPLRSIVWHLSTAPRDGDDNDNDNDSDNRNHGDDLFAQQADMPLQERAPLRGRQIFAPPDGSGSRTRSPRPVSPPPLHGRRELRDVP